MTDTKEEAKVNETNAKPEEVKARPRANSHNKIDMKNLFKSKHNSKKESKENLNEKQGENKADEKRKSHGKIDLKNLFKSKHNSQKQSKENLNENEKHEEKKEEQPKPAEDKPENNDTIDLEGDAKKPLDDCEGCKDEVLGETDKAVGKPITGFSEKVGASFRKWFHLAGAPQGDDASKNEAPKSKS